MMYSVRMYSVTIFSGGTARVAGHCRNMVQTCLTWLPLKVNQNLSVTPLVTDHETRHNNMT